MSVGEVFPVSAADLAALHSQLAQTADSADLLDLSYRLIDSPIGRLLLAATPRGLVRIAFEYEGFDEVLESLATKISPRILEGTNRLDAAWSELDEYFTGRRKAFDLELDFALSSGFRQHVQRYLPQIGYGQTRSYKQVAELVGNPRAVRAVGSACATNPLPVVVPCHRVLRADGSLGGYLGGLEIKRTLLQIESSAA